VDTGVIKWVNADLVTHICPRVGTSYQMKRSDSENAVIFIGMRHLNTTDITASYGVLRVRAAVAIAALMAVLVFVGGANAHHNGETEVPQKTEIEA